MLKTYISESIDYLRYIRKYILVSVLLFFLAALGGAYYAQNFPNETASYLQQMQEFFNSMDHETTWQTFMSIFENNTDAMLLTVGMGIFAGLMPIVFLFSNGFMIGLVAYIFMLKSSWIVFAAGILPHGIIELPCMFIAASIGMCIGKTAILRLFGEKISLTDEIARGVKFAVLVIVPSLFIAALIEAYITPYFIAMAQIATGQ